MSLRSLSEIAVEIRKEWGVKLNYAAKPYVDAMIQLNDVSDMYGLESGSNIVRRFLCNASSFRGNAARRIKKELKEIIGEK
jgi:hypothetical protein